MGNEVRLALRRLAKHPALTLAAVITLAFGIGACTAMFSIVQAVLLKSMDVAEPGRLVVMWPQLGDSAGEFSYEAYHELSRPSVSFDRVALSGSANWPVPVDILLPDGRRTRATQCAVSDTFFDVLGAQPLLGRTFQSGDDHPGAPLGIVVSAAFWHAKLGADPAVVGRTLDIGGDAWRIIGVMPPDFFYPAGADFWTPAATLLAMTSPDKSPAALADLFKGVGAFHVLARLKPGASIAQAQIEMTRRWSTLTAVAEARVAVRPWLEHVFGTARRALWLLLGAVGLVLVIAVANVAGLLAARNALRSRELAIRRALGATGWHLVQYSLAEAGVLAVPGGAIGVAVAAGGVRALLMLSPATVVRLSDTRVDAVVLAACAAITGVVTIGVTVIPALQSRRPAGLSSLKALATREPGLAIRGDTRRLLVVAQVAIALTLLTGSALAVQTLRHMAAIDLGFDPTKLLALDTSRLDQSRYPTEAARQRAIDDLVTRLRQLPGVQAAAAVLNRPFAHGVIGWDSSVLLEGQTDIDTAWRKNPVVNFEAITPSYFQTMAIRVRGGRDFATTDGPGAPPVAIVSDTLAARLWPGENPIGRRLLDSFGRRTDVRSSQWRTVVGVVGAAHYRDADRPRVDLYVPVAQAASFVPENLVVRTSGAPRALIPAVVAVMSTVDSQLTVADVTTMEEVMRHVRAPWRFNMLLFSVFGCLSIGLTLVGIAGLAMSTVNSQRREIGVRLALGARPPAVVMMVAMQGARLIGAGVAIGILSSLLTARLLSGLLFGVTATDPRTLIAVAVGVLALGTAAAYVPARRAATLDPCRIFREE